jgi:two-component sensor histidine kinase
MAIERDRHERNLKTALERQQFLLREMNHRVKNSLTMICGLLHLQAKQADVPEIAHQFDDAVHRITAVARAYELLHQDADVGSLDIGRYLKATCHGVNAGLSNIAVHVEADYEIEIATDDAISAALIVNELITNAAKYAYPAGSGNVCVTVVHLGEAGFRISVCDEGAGLPLGFDPGKEKGLGMRIVSALTKQLRGTLEIHRGNPGTEFVINVTDARRDMFPAPTGTADAPI